MGFVDLVSAFDLLCRSGIWALLLRLGIPAQVVGAIRGLYDGQMCVVELEGAFSEPFPVHSGGRQGSVEGPSLFLIWFEAVLRDWKSRTPDSGIYLHTILDGYFKHYGKLNADQALTLWRIISGKPS